MLCCCYLYVMYVSYAALAAFRMLAMLAEHTQSKLRSLPHSSLPVSLGLLGCMSTQVDWWEVWAWPLHQQAGPVARRCHRRVCTSFGAGLSLRLWNSTLSPQGLLYVAWFRYAKTHKLSYHPHILYILIWSQLMSSNCTLYDIMSLASLQFFLDVLTYTYFEQPNIGTFWYSIPCILCMSVAFWSSSNLHVQIATGIGLVGVGMALYAR